MRLRKKPLGRRRPAQPPDEWVDWLLWQLYSESNVCALPHLIAAPKPYVHAKVQRFLTTRKTTANHTPPLPHNGKKAQACF